MPRFGFETLYAPPQLDLACLGKVASLSLILLTRETVESWPFWFLLFLFTIRHGHSRWPWCYCSHVGLTRKFSFNVDSFFAMCEPLASQLWNLWSCELYWVLTFTEFNIVQLRAAELLLTEANSKLSKVSRTWQMTQFVIREWLEDILGSFASTTTAFNQVHHLHGRPFGTLLPRIVR